MGKCMKVLLFEWASVTRMEIRNVFQKFGWELSCVSIPFTSFASDWKLYEKFEPYLKKDKFDFVFSTNYFDMIAEACHQHGVKYIAWTYDSPATIGDLRFLGYETNFVFMFDKKEAKLYQSLGFSNVWHLPLAVNADRYDNYKTLKRKNQKYVMSEISFVGKLYQNNLSELTACLSDYYKSFLNAIVDSQTKIHGYNMFKHIINQQTMEKMCNPAFNQILNKKDDSPFLAASEKEEEVSARTPEAGDLIIKLDEAVTNRERLMVLGLLASHHELKLFSYQDSDVLKKAVHCGCVDYYDAMPNVFHYSKINMNISLCAIESAIPLRCLDIMACQGLLMSNFQPELAEYFENGKEMLIYESPEDALAKADYYLDPKHEEERKKIALNGYEKVKRDFNYRKMMGFILEKAGLGTLE